MKNVNIHVKLSGFSLLTGLLFTLAWPPAGIFPLAFAAFIPLFYIQYLIRQREMNAGWAFLYGYMAFLSFNLGTTWWVWNASAGGAVMAFLLNSLLMNVPFMFWYFLNRKHHALRIWPFIWAWLSFEYFHYRWDGTWTWLSLGNVFADVPWLVQWYEYTGVAGGTLWVLWVNKSLFEWLISYETRDRQQRMKTGFNLAFFRLFAPGFLSVFLLNQYKQTEPATPVTSRVMVVQPNIDPYKDKFAGLTAYEQTIRLLNIAEQHMDPAVQLVMFPETALVGQLDEKNLQQEETVLMLKQFMRKYPNVNIVTGADTYRDYQPGEKLSETVRTHSSGVLYDSYNTALVFAAGDSNIGVYHKSKLVPGVERLPFASLFKYVNDYAIDLGGTSGSLGVDPEPKSFALTNRLNVAPIICYESIFGEYITEYVKRGASLLCIITNDGWWGNTPGYRQHMAYARLRAVETRRYVARSANTGISSFIDDKGNVLVQSGWWEPAALKYDVKLNTRQTFYVKHGDVINEVAVLLTIYTLFLLMVANTKRKLV